MTTMQINNNTAGEVARAFKFRADFKLEQASDDDADTTKQARRVLYNTAALDYESAQEWFERARGLTIGNNKRWRYEQAADKCKEQGELCASCVSALAD